jgi:hypothetical protein
MQDGKNFGTPRDALSVGKFFEQLNATQSENKQLHRDKKELQERLDQLNRCQT